MEPIRICKALAYHPAPFLRWIEVAEAMADWSRASLRIKLIKIGTRVVRQVRALPFQVVEVRSPVRWWGPSSPLSADCAPPRCR